MSELTDLLFIRGEPALLLKEERCLVAGDLHIGADLGFRERGIHFENAAVRSAKLLNRLYEENGAKKAVLLGDMKQSISFPEREEREEIGKFFENLRCGEVEIVKGNHDANLEKLLVSLGYSYGVKKELLLGRVAFLHGNSLPSGEAMMMDYLIIAHSHVAMPTENGLEKVWLVAKLGEGVENKYKKYNKRIRLVVMPAFNELITGRGLGLETKDYTPLLRSDIFNFEGAGVYSLSGSLFGYAGRLARQIRQG